MKLLLFTSLGALERLKRRRKKIVKVLEGETKERDIVRERKERGKERERVKTEQKTSWLEIQT